MAEAGGPQPPQAVLTTPAHPAPFTFAVGLALLAAGAHLCLAAARGFRARKEGAGLDARFHRAAAARRGRALAPAGIPDGEPIATVSRSAGRITIAYWGETWRLSESVLALTGFLVGIVSSALGVGGGFLLVPIFSALYRLPMYVLVAATIPYVIVLSAVGLLTWALIVPQFSDAAVAPEWAWGFFAASGGILGAWCAAKTQRFVPEHTLKLMLGSITALAGALYAGAWFIDLPFRL